MIWTDDPHWRKLLLFHEFFHGDSGRGLGANHQTGWTALVARLLEDRAKLRGWNQRAEDALGVANRHSGPAADGERFVAKRSFCSGPRWSRRTPT